MGLELAPNYTSLLSMTETEQEQEQGCLSCTTFNILAPIYKRLDQQVWKLLTHYYYIINQYPSSCNKLHWLFFFWWVWNRIRVFEKVSTGPCGWAGTKGFWIGCSINLPPSSVFKWVFNIHKHPFARFLVDLKRSISRSMPNFRLLWFLLYWVGVLGWKWRTCEYVPEEARRCRLYHLQSCKN